MTIIRLSGLKCKHRIKLKLIKSNYIISLIYIHLLNISLIILQNIEVSLVFKSNTLSFHREKKVRNFGREGTTREPRVYIVAYNKYVSSIECCKYN